MCMYIMGNRLLAGGRRDKLIADSARVELLDQI